MFKKNMVLSAQKYLKAVMNFTDLQESEQNAMVSSFLSSDTLQIKEFFLPHEIAYKSFPAVDKKVMLISNLLKKYLQSVNEEAENSQLVHNLLGAMVRDSCTLNVFYFGFSKYLNEIDNNQENKLPSDIFLFEKLIKDILEMAPYCSERDLAASIGYFMDVLSWDTREKPKDLESISLYSIRKNMLDICKENILGNIFFPPYMLYEIAIREKNAYKKEKYFDYCLNMIKENEKNLIPNKNNKLVKTIGSLAIKINTSYSLKIKANIYFELMHNFYENNDSEQFYTCLKNIKELVTSLSDINFKKLSFDLSCEVYNHVVEKIKNSMSRFDFKKMDNFHAVDVEKQLKNFIILSTYIFLLQSIIDQCDFFQRYSLSSDVDLDFSLVNKLSSIMSPELRSNVSLITNRVREKFQEGTIDINTVYKKTSTIKDMVMPLKQEINTFLDIIKEPYYAAIKQYMLSLIPEAFSHNFIDETHSKGNNISFLINSRRDISKMIKKHEKILSFDAGVLTLNINNMDIKLDDIANIVNEIYRVKKRIQDQKLIIQVQQSAMPVQFSGSLLQENAIPSQTKIEVVELSEIDDTLSLTNKKNEKTAKQPARGKTIKSKHQRSKKQETILKAAVEIKSESNLNKLIAKAINFLEPENKKELDDLVEARNYTLGFIQNSTMKKPIIVAVNKRLVDQNGANISKKSQEKINTITQNICFVSKFGQDGIKRYNQKYGLKVRYADNKSYRADPSKIKSYDDLMIIKYDEVIDKVKKKRKKL